MASVLTTTQIVTEYGQYYVKEGQNRSRLFRALQQMPVTLEQHARHIRTTETKYRMANYKTGAVLQPFTITFNPMMSDFTNVTYRIVKLTSREMEWQKVGTAPNPGTWASDYRHFVRVK